MAAFSTVEPDYGLISIGGGQTAPIMLNFDTIYTSVSVLGKGTYGKVILLSDNRTKEQLAGKFIKVPRLGGMGLISQSMKEVNMLREINIKNKTLAPEWRVDIPEYYGCFFVDDRTDPIFHFFVILMEYVSGITLSTIIESWSKNAKQDDYIVMKQHYQLTMVVTQWLYRNLKNLHALGVVHRDLKPANIIKRRAGVYTLVDFGFACRLHDSTLAQTPPGEGLEHLMEKLELNPYCRPIKNGSPLYTAPELYGHISTIDEFRQTDIWSAGIILWELSNLKKFAAHIATVDKLINYIITTPIETTYQPPFDRIIIESLRLKPTDRPSAAEIDSFIQDFVVGVLLPSIRVGKPPKLAVMLE